MKAGATLLVALCCWGILEGVLADAGESCSVDVWRGGERYEPVLACGHQLAMPDRATGRLELQSGQQLLVACTGPRNHLLSGGTTNTTANCFEGGTTLQVAGSEVSANDLWCERRSTAEVIATDEQCGPDNAFRLFEIGFNVSARWFAVLHICHDAKNANTFYSRHFLYGSLLKHRRHQLRPRPTFQQGCESGELYGGLSPNQLYSKHSIEDSLAAALGSRERVDDYLSRSPLSRGHLAPSADFILNTHQLASFFYVNTAPQWQVFNEGNWLSLETVLRNHASRRGLDLEVWTGTLGVQSVEGAELYLAEGGRLAVPLYFWKLVRDPRSGEAVAFVGLNDPFAKHSPEQPCPDVCEQAGWTTRRRAAKWRRLHRGLIWCCDADALRQAAPGVPDLRTPDGDVKILPGPNALSRRRRRSV